MTLTSQGKYRSANSGSPVRKNCLASDERETLVAELVELGGLLRTNLGSSALSSASSSIRLARFAHGLVTICVLTCGTTLSLGGIR